MCFKSKEIKFDRPDLILGDSKIPLVSKYLGITISEKNCDQDIHRQMRKLYYNANILLRRFSNVLLMLNAIYCIVQIYIVHLFGMILVKEKCKKLRRLLTIIVLNGY